MRHVFCGAPPGKIHIDKMAKAGAAGVAGNLLLGGFIGAGVDAYNGNGAAMDHKPNPVIVPLRPNAPHEDGPRQAPVRRKLRPALTS
jgi:hypothetical protein